jgi:hypothetical protein
MHTVSLMAVHWGKGGGPTNPRTHCSLHPSPLAQPTTPSPFPHPTTPVGPRQLSSTSTSTPPFSPLSPPPALGQSKHPYASDYGFTKAVSEHMVLQAPLESLGRLRTLALRPHNVMGPGDVLVTDKLMLSE